ncbi:MAG: hypothetical protein ABI347_06895 [Nitrososphaera sp.]
MKEFRVLLTCHVCGETFDSDYKLMKHTSKSHPQADRAGWTGSEGEHNCSCGGGGHHNHYHHMHNSE